VEPTPAPEPAAPAPTPPTTDKAAAAQRSETQRLSPAVRRLVAEHEIDVDSVHGSGRDGRITRRNVIEYLETRGNEPEPVPAEPPVAVTAPAATPPAAAPESAPESAAAPPAAPAAAATRTTAAAPAAATAGTVPFNRIRRLTAEHMVRSKATSPHVLQAVEVDFSGVDRVRKAVRESWRAQHGFSLTYLPFIAHAVCAALREFPNVNASVEGDSLVLHPHVNLAIAVDLGADGLMAPVVRSAELLSVTDLAKAIQDIAGRARSNKLKPDDLSGGTYTLSNSGTFGTLITAPIINQPQVAILSTDGVRKKPVVIERSDGDSIAIRPVGILAQSFDHRAIDGAYSAAFLDRTRKLLELTDWFREI
jgi:2-oxoglutarate dehydrogenase E2 component (dihydrolipoamide succinyltransferase)